MDSGNQWNQWQQDNLTSNRMVEEATNLSSGYSDYSLFNSSQVSAFFFIFAGFKTHSQIIYIVNYFSKLS